MIKGLPEDRIPRVVAARVCGPFSVFVVFDDGVSKEVNLRERLKGPVYKPVRARGGFAKLRVDHEVGTIVWTDQADIAPETLYLLPDERKRRPQSKKPSRRRKSSRGSFSAVSRLPKNRIPVVVHAKVCGPFSVFLVFDDGVSKEVNLKRRLKGPVFEPFRTPEGFAKLRVDHEAGTIVWSDQADIAPETLYLLPDERKRARQSKKPARRKKSSKGSSSAA